MTRVNCTNICCRYSKEGYCILEEIKLDDDIRCISNVSALVDNEYLHFNRTRIKLVPKKDIENKDE